MSDSGLLPPRPADFSDGPVALAWFSNIAETLLNRCEVVVGGVVHHLIEVEFYCNTEGHKDPFTHGDPMQKLWGHWYFHRTNGVLRSGSFKGVDLSFGDGQGFCGVLCRGLEAEDGTVIDGPSLLVDRLLEMTRFSSLQALDKAVAARKAWDPGNHVLLRESAQPRSDPLLQTPRVGLSLKKATGNSSMHAFLMRPYRFLTQPRKTAKGKTHMALALHARGLSPEEISARTGCPLKSVRSYIADFEAGRQETDFTPYHGADMKGADLCRVYGLWHAHYGSRL